MTDIHIIRLGDPWQTVAADNRSWMLHCRKFGKPSHLGAERVWLVIDAADAALAVRLNGRDLANTSEDGGFQADITDRLEGRNRIELELAVDRGRPAVRLEIRSR